MTDVEAQVLDLFADAMDDLNLSPELRVAWQNVPFTPGATETFLQASVLFSEPDMPGLGHASSVTYKGLFQVSVFVPIGRGALVAAQIAGDIRDYFKRGTRFAGQVTVEVGFGTPRLETPMKESERWNQPVTIPWFVIV